MSTGFETTKTCASVENADEERHVAVDEVEARLIRLTAQAGRDQEDVAVGGAIVVTCVNLLVAAERSAVQQVERLTLGQILVRVEDLQLGHQSAALQRKRRARAHAATAANDCDFHKDLTTNEHEFISWAVASAQLGA
jgi:hypothetical protein